MLEGEKRRGGWRRQGGKGKLGIRSGAGEERGEKKGGRGRREEGKIWEKGKWWEGDQKGREE
jgi:hypothetical protein